MLTIHTNNDTKIVKNAGEANYRNDRRNTLFSSLLSHHTKVYYLKLLHKTNIDFFWQF